MQEVVQTTFHSTVEFLPSEFEVMPLSRWTESVLRYYFCRFLTKSHPEVEQFIECGRIDLVLWMSPHRAFPRTAHSLSSSCIDTLFGSIPMTGRRGAPKEVQDNRI